MPHIDQERIALKWRRTKIVATLGPASESEADIRRLLKAGVDVVRLNMSHGDHDGHRELFARVRGVAEGLDRHVAILMDLCGPKIRVGRFRDGMIELRDGQRVIVTSRDVAGEEGLIPSQYRKLHKDVKRGERILLDDGNLELRVLSVKGTEVSCRVVHGGPLKDHKGMNLPDSSLSTPAFTDKDKADALLAMELGADFLALSFVRGAADVARLQRFMKRNGDEIPVVSKIERPEAVANIDEILRQSYAIMVARGDLGIELPAEQVPLIQRELINKARLAHVPVIVATQMLESMIGHSRPTRAEVGDVANAAETGTDAVMLSAETASGQYPLRAVQIMDRVLRETERHQWHEGRFGSALFSDRRKSDYSFREAIAHAAQTLSSDLKLQAMVIPTHSGTTARVLAAHRAIAPMVGVCDRAAICRRLSLHWGIVPVHRERPAIEDWRQLCADINPHTGLTRPGHAVLVVSGFHDDPRRNEPVLKLMSL